MSQSSSLPAWLILIIRTLWKFAALLPAGLIRAGARFLFRKNYALHQQASKNPRATQEQHLLKVLQQNRDTVFGREHSFLRIDSVKSFQQQVPIRSYDDFAPYIQRMLQGESAVLVNEALTFFARSSGTTGAAKYIPVTESYLEEMRAVRLMWMRSIALVFPGLVKGLFLTMHSPGIEGHSASGVPFGSITVAMAGEKKDALGEAFDGIPASIFTIKDFDSKYYVLLRAALDRPISLVGAMNPSTLLILFQRLSDWAETLAEDLENGRISPPNPVDQAVLKDMHRSTIKRPKMARRLRQSLARHGFVKAREVWPELCGVLCWKGGSAGFYLDKLRPYIGDLPVMDYGYAASEGAFNIVEDAGAGCGVVGVEGHFLEFIPEERYGKADAPALLVDELEAGKRYAVIITAANGLFRYDIGDMIEVCDFAQNLPRVRFVHKSGQVISLTGEKVSEAQIVQAITDAQQHASVQLDGFLVTAKLADPSFYILAAESQVLSTSEIQNLLDAFDQDLQLGNIEYQAKRASQRLGPPRFVRCNQGAFSQLRHAGLRKGASDAQIKTPHLWNDVNVLDKVCDNPAAQLETT